MLTHHCWSSQQSLFVGCRGGQLLSIDFDTAIIQVLANPQLTQVEPKTTAVCLCILFSYPQQQSMGREEYEEKSHQQGGGREGEEMEELPNTAHAVLREGSLECLALGRRGLFAAGKVSCHMLVLLWMGLSTLSWTL